MTSLASQVKTKPVDLTQLNRLFEFDQQFRLNTHDVIIIGADEVGRGSCIGPVTAGAALSPISLSPDIKAELFELNDSKQLSPNQRERVNKALLRHGNHNSILSSQLTLPLTAIGEATQDDVDQYNVYHASLLAIHRAINNLLKAHPILQTLPCVLLLDGKATLPEKWLPPLSQPVTQQAIVKGDGKSFAIAAASVVAKHHRDTLVSRWVTDYPHYGWETNMGYPTPSHKAALMQYGPTPKHRQSYAVVQKAKEAFTMKQPLLF